MACEELSSIKMTCDRCGHEETADRKNRGDDKFGHWMTVDMRLNNGDFIGPPAYSADYDLCPTCATMLWRWTTDAGRRALAEHEGEG